MCCLGPQGITLGTVHTDKFLPWGYLYINSIGASQPRGVHTLIYTHRVCRGCLLHLRMSILLLLYTVTQLVIKMCQLFSLVGSRADTGLLVVNRHWDTHASGEASDNTDLDGRQPCVTRDEEIHCNIFTVHILVDCVLHCCWKSICEQEVVVLSRGWWNKNMQFVNGKLGHHIRYTNLHHLYICRFPCTPCWKEVRCMLANMHSAKLPSIFTNTVYNFICL